MADTKYNIVLGATIDLSTLKANIKQISNLPKVKIAADATYLKKSISDAIKNMNAQNIKVEASINTQNIINQVSAAVKNAVQSATSSASNTISSSYGNGSSYLSKASTIRQQMDSITTTPTTSSQYGRGSGTSTTRTTTSDSGYYASKTGLWANVAAQSDTGDLTKTEKMYTQLTARVQALTNQHLLGSKAAKAFSARLSEIYNIKSPEEQIEAMTELKEQISATQHSTDTLFNSVKKFTAWYLIAGVVSSIVGYIKDIPAQIKALDDALVELNKVADISAQEQEELTQRAFELGEQVGRTGTEVIDAITEIKRAGFSLEESEYIAKYALQLTNVAEGITDAGEAAQYLISILKGADLEIEYSSTLLDELNEISNNSAINFDNLADMTQSVAGTMTTLGNSIEETMAMLTGAYEVLQDDRVAKGISTIGLRISGLTEDLEEEAGLQSKVNEALEEYANISVFDTMTGQLRSTFEILDDLAEKWDTLSKNTQAYLTTTLAGKNRADVLTALMNNWEGVADAMEQAENSAGSAEQEQSAYLDSVSGKLELLSNAWQELSDATLNSGILKFAIDLGTALTNVMTATGGLVPTLISVVSILGIIKSYNALKFLDGAAEKIRLVNGTTKILTASATKLQISFGWVSLAVSAVVSIVNLFKTAQEEAAAELTESNEKIQENIDAIQQQIDAYDSQKAEIKALEKEKEYLESIENKTQTQSERLIKVTNDLAEAQEKLNKTVNEGTGEYESYIDAQYAALSSQYSLYVAQNKLAYKKAVNEKYSVPYYTDRFNLEAITEILSSYGVDYDLSIESSSYSNLQDYVEGLEKIILYISNSNLPETESDLLLRLGKPIIEAYQEAKANLESYNQVIADYEEAQAMVALYTDTNIEAMEKLKDQYAEFTDATTEEKLAMIDSNSEFMKSLKNVDALKEKYPEAASAIEQLTEDIWESVEAFKSQDLFIDIVDDLTESITKEQEAWEAELEAEEERQKLIDKRNAVTEAQQDLDELNREGEYEELGILEKQLEIAEAELETLKTTNDEKEKELELEEKTLAVEKARIALEEAKHKQVQVYRTGQGMVFAQDTASITEAAADLADAEQELADYNKELAIDAKEKEIDQLEADIEAIETTKENSEKLEKLTTALEDAKKELAEYEQELSYSNRLKNVDALSEMYYKLMQTYGTDATRGFFNENYSMFAGKSYEDILSFLTSNMSWVTQGINKYKAKTDAVSSAISSGATGGIGAAIIGEIIGELGTSGAYDEKLKLHNSGNISGNNNTVTNGDNYTFNGNIVVEKADSLETLADSIKNKNISSIPTTK